MYGILGFGIMIKAISATQYHETCRSRPEAVCCTDKEKHDMTGFYIMLKMMECERLITRRTLLIQINIACIGLEACGRDQLGALSLECSCSM